MIEEVNMLRWLLMILFFPASAVSQDSSGRPSLSLNGYLKEMGQFVFPKDPYSFQYTNLIHNRMNVKWHPDGPFQAAIELRNRYFVGDMVENDPEFNRHLKNPQDLVNLNVIWYQSPSAVLTTNVERAWLLYQWKRVNVRVGRQRVNWGMANIWNPNDIFNSYNLLDFDYEERPGSDAAKVQYIMNDQSHLEVVAAHGPFGNPTAAVKYWVNKNEFDWQLIAGTYDKKFTTGLGWAGNLGKAGFKGEGQLFFGRDSVVLNMTAELDYMTEKGWYLHSALLYNSLGSVDPVDDWMSFGFKNTPDRLMPTRWNLLIGTSRTFADLFSGSLVMIYAPGTNMLIFFPSLTYNVATDIDLDLFWQSFFAETRRGFSGVVHSGYLRVKWSF